MELSIYLKFYIYLYNDKTETAIFIATKHEKNNYGSYLNWYKYFFHFHLLARQQKYYKNETGEKFINLLAMNLVKYSSEFLAHIKKHLGHTGTATNIQTNYMKLPGSALI